MTESYEQPDIFSRRNDPETSREASKQRKRDPGPEHYFVLEHHLEHIDTDANAGQAALEAGVVNTQEHGRRASRTIREDFGWTEIAIDPESGRPITRRNRMSNRSGQANKLTAFGLEVFDKRWKE
jgi:hypothetical protein